MNFRDKTQYVFEVHRKANSVILSCRNMDQLESAMNYVDNLKKQFSTIKCNNKIEKDVINSIVKHVDGLIKIKRKSLK